VATGLARPDQSARPRGGQRFQPHVASHRGDVSDPEKDDSTMATRSPGYTDKPMARPSDAHERGRGRNARKPSEVPAPGWLDILARTKQQLTEDNLTIVAAGVAFYGFVSVVPALGATIAIYGLVADPANVTDQVMSLASVVPEEVMPMLQEQMKRITTNTGAAGFSAILGVLIALYSSANATKALISGLNIAYDETEKRGFLKLTLIAMVLTIGAIIAAALAIGLVAVLPSVLKHLNISGTVETVLNIARWPILIGGFISSLAVLYRFGPCRTDAKWRWVSPGAVVAAILWLIGSLLFSLYVSKVGSYDKTYGPLGAVVVFLMWLYISALSVLVGAEFNSEMERQTKRDTTEGAEKPLGQRGATSADTVGPSREEMRPVQKQ
jgi:membrane protein